MQQLSVEQLTSLDYSTQVKLINEDTENNNTRIKLSEALSRLNDNEDFQLVMHKYFMEDEAVRITRLRLEPTLVDSQRMDLENMLIAVGTVPSMFMAIHSNANKARADNVRNEDYLSLDEDERAGLLAEAQIEQQESYSV